MKKFIFCLFVTFLLMLSTQSIYAQFNSNAAKMELEKRGLTEEEVRQALIAKGIDVDNIDTTDPQELAKYEKTIREVIAELEAKKKNSGDAGTDVPQTSTGPTIDQIKKEKAKAAIKSEEVKEAIEDGATVEEAINEELQEKQNDIAPAPIIYGQHIFRDKSIKLFRTTEGAKVPQSYKLGAGDVVNIAIWGDSEFNLSQEISSEGFIKPNNQPRIFLSGLTIAQAKEVVYKSLKRFIYFNRSELAVTLITSRTQNVNIVGEVFNPGSYNISAINTGVNALVAAGGPSNIGSVRSIKLMSAGKEVKTIDLYQYLLNPIVSEDFYLSENDYLFVPVSEKVVSISGAVNRPYRYELKDNENLLSLISFAGGLKANAIKKNIQIIRIDNDDRIIIDVDYTKAKDTDFALRDGDLINVSSIANEADNIITISGAVENPGDYEFEDGLKISDVLAKAKLKEDAITDIVYVRRLNPDLKTRRYEIFNINDALQDINSPANIELKKGDVISITSTTSYVDNYTVEIEGEVRNPGTFQLDENDDLRVSDLIFLAGGITDDVNNFAYVFRKDPENINKNQYLYIDLQRVLQDENSEDNIVLKPEDRVVLYSKKTFYEENSIKVEGAVRNPGEIQFNDGLTLRDALLISGGLKREASNSRIEVYRIVMEGDKKTQTLVAKVGVDASGNFEDSKSFFLQPYDQIRVRKAPEFELQQNVNIYGEVAYPGTYSLLSDNTRISDLIRQSGNITDEAFLGAATLYRDFDNTGYVIIDLEEALKNPDSKNDIILRAGDELTIPKRNTLVAISGATNAAEYYPENIVNGKINVSYEGKMNANKYLNKYAGGVADDGDKKSIVVEYPNGQIKKTKRFLFFNIYPKVKEGSHIKVAKKVQKTKEEKEKEDIDWGEVLANSITQATAILSLVLLLRSLD